MPSALGGAQFGRQWLCVQIPQWPLVAAMERAGFDSSVPVALVNRGRVRMVSPAGFQMGIRRGMKESTALHLLPEITFLTPDSEVEAQEFTRVTQALRHVAATIYQLRPGLVFVPVSRYGSANETELARENKLAREEVLASAALEAVVETTGYEAHAGVAWGMFAAIIAAHQDQLVPKKQSLPYLHAQRTSALLHLSANAQEQRFLQTIHQHLADLGVQTLGQWAAWKSSQTGKQFGSQGIKFHRATQGEDWPVAVAPLPRSDLTWQLSYDPPLERYEQLIFQARALLEEAVADLIFQSKTCDLLTIKLVDVAGNEDIRSWGVASLELATLQRSIQWHIEGWLNTHHDRQVSQPLAEFIIIAHQPQSAAVAQSNLWHYGSKSEQVLRMVNRLDGLLATSGVYIPVPRGHYHPAKQVELKPWQEVFAEEEPAALSSARSFSSPQVWPGQLPAPFPSQLVQKQLRAAVFDADGQPVSVSARGVLTSAPAWVQITGAVKKPMQIEPVASWKGPWVYHQGWWHDQPPHQLLFLFREQKPGLLLAACEAEEPLWQVEGIYE